jgi:NADPH2:quinone reductase
MSRSWRKCECPTGRQPDGSVRHAAASLTPGEVRAPNRPREQEAETRMKALLCEAHGPAETWSSATLPSRPGPGEVVVAVKAAALNFFDTLIIEGRYQTKPALPFSPSAECAGTIASIGEGVTGWRVGERVAAWLGHRRGPRKRRRPRGGADPRARFARRRPGGRAVRHLWHRDARADPARRPQGRRDAGGARRRRRGRPRRGRDRRAARRPCHRLRLLARQARAGSRARRAGGDRLQPARISKAGLRRLSEGRGVDVLYDTVGGDLAEPAVRAMAWEGRYLVVGFAGGAIPKIRSTCCC